MGLKREDVERLLASKEPLPAKIPLRDEMGKQWQLRSNLSGIQWTLEETCTAILEQHHDKAIAVRAFTRRQLGLNKEKTAEQGKPVYDLSKFEFAKNMNAMDAVEFIGLYGNVDIAPIVATHQAKLVKEEERKASEQAAKEAVDKLTVNVSSQTSTDNSAPSPVDIGTPADNSVPSTDNSKPETVNRPRGRKTATV